MDAFIILKIALLGLIISILNQILKQSGRDELAFMSSLAGIVVVLFWLLPHIQDLFMTIQQLFNMV
ncbi:MAG: putative rane protein [Herbinix sp.]|jgi:stage III sporulation protein AC|nr:putative rane protein [Herbinix sp.]